MDARVVSGCAGKHRFDDHRIAKEVAKQQSRRHECKISVYRCKCCNGWHTGQHDQFQKTRKIRGEKND